MIVGVLVLSMMFSGSVLSYLNWNGFANTSEMSKAEKEALLKDNVAFAVESVDAEYYLLKNGNSVTVSLNANDECILECGMIKDGNYNFYVMYYSADKSIFTECMVDDIK